jgi:nicotinate-nucleotide adenylyltransferase
MRIGLLGGSFNPPHAAHLLISKTALQRLQLDRVWWLLSPGNPLKDTRELAPLEKRLRLARDLIDDSRIVPTAAERELRTRYTVDTVRVLHKRCPNVRFVWLMGADNLAEFHRWKNWRAVAAGLPIAVFDRPGFSNTALRGRAALALAGYRLDESDAGLLADRPPPAWVFIHGPRSPLSSTALRRGKSSA